MVVPFLTLAVPLVYLVFFLQRNRSGSSGKHSGGSGDLSQGAVTPDPRFATGPSDGSAPAQDPGSAYQPDPRFGLPDTAFPPGAAAATSVLASTTASSGGQSDFAGSTSTTTTSGDPFPTRGRALSLIGGQALATLGLLVMLLDSKPSGHHDSHATNGSVALLGLLCAFVGCSFSTFAAGRVQRDVMGGGWKSQFALQYISPQIIAYVNGPSGIGDAARRLNIAPALAMLVVYGLFAADLLLIAARYFGR